MDSTKFMKEIELIGDSFRGLWVTCEVSLKGKKTKKKWSVTFIFKGDYVETLYYDTPLKAVNHAVKVLKL